MADVQPETTSPSGPRFPVRRIAGSVVTAFAFALVWAALVFPMRLGQLSLVAFVRIPVEGLCLVALSLFLPVVPRRILAAVAGVLLGLLTVLKILDLGFYEGLDRPFNLLLDWSNFGPAVGLLRDSVGGRWVNLIVVGLGLSLVSIVVAIALSTVRVCESAARHRGVAGKAVGSAGVVWVVCAFSAAQLVAGAPIASTSTAGLAADEVVAVHATIQDQQTFDAALASGDPAPRIPRADLLSGLRGKDVIVAFVESYGQVAVQGTSFSPGVDTVLRAGTAQLAAAGFDSRSAFLTSPTFGGISWLAHSTLQSGLWIDSQQRYDQLVSSHRYTLSDAFGRAGWRTVSDVPSDDAEWPEGKSFYHYDKLYNAANVGYAGPRFSYARIPDQYTLSHFQRTELTPHHTPVMAEIDFVSSHTPWTPLPHMVPWNAIGDGSIYRGMPRQGESPSTVWTSAAHVQELYGESIQYSLNALISFVTRAHDNNLVLVMLGDHQPSTIVSGENASHDVPITIVAHDPSVIGRIAPWGWQSGLLPHSNAPIWPMSAFRNRFLTAFDSAALPSPFIRAAALGH